MSHRKLNWSVSEEDARRIGANRWNFQIAKCVASGDSGPTYNIVWQSLGLAPNADVAWKAQYALGWSARTVADGVRASVTGRWQPCGLGQAFDLDNNGYWMPSSTAGSPGYLTVGKINYAYPGIQGIHIVVGVLNEATNRYDIVWIDKNAKPPGSSGRYQPQETMTWWLEGGDQTGQFYSNTKGRSMTFDFANPSDPATNAYEWTTSFNTQTGQWTIVPGEPPQRFVMPPPSNLDGW